MEIVKRFLFLLFQKLAKKREVVQGFLSRKGLGRIPGINIPYSLLTAVHDSIYDKLKPKGVILIDVQGSKIYVDTDDRSIVPLFLVDGVMEKYETELFKQIVKEGMVVVDIGAHVGYYTLIAAKLVGKNGTVYAFEPEPSSYELLCKNIEVNRYTNVVPVPKAVSNKQEGVKLWFDKVNLPCSSFSKENVSFFSKEKVSSVEVETITLDEFFDKVVKANKVDFMKIDTQGTEGLIIDGAEKILKSNSLKIIMEFGPDLLRNLGTDPLKLLEELKNYGFKINLINEKNQSLDPVETINFFEKAKAGKEFNLLLEK